MKRIFALILVLFALTACSDKDGQDQQETLEEVTEKAHEALINANALQLKSNVQFTFDGEKTMDETLKTTMQMEPYLYHQKNVNDASDEHYVTTEEWYKRVGKDGDWHLDTRYNASLNWGSTYLHYAIEYEAISLKKFVDVKDEVTFEEKSDGYHITFSSSNEERIKEYLKQQILRYIDLNYDGLIINSLEEKTVISKETYEIISRTFTINMDGKVSADQQEDAEMTAVFSMTDYKYALDEVLEIPELAIEQAKATASKSQGVEIMEDLAGMLYASTSIRSESNVTVTFENGSERLESYFYLYTVQDFNPNFKSYIYYEDQNTSAEMQFDRKTAYARQGNEEPWQEWEADPTLFAKLSLDKVMKSPGKNGNQTLRYLQN